MIDLCHCGGHATECADLGEHTGPDARMATGNDREMARGAVGIEPRCDRTGDDCDCDARNTLFRSLGLPPGVCLACTAREQRGIGANSRPARTGGKAA